MPPGREKHLSGLYIELTDNDRTEIVQVRDVARQDAVHRSDYERGRKPPKGKCPEKRANLVSNVRRRHPMAGYVAEHELVDIVVEEEAIEEIPRYIHGGKKDGGDIETLDSAEVREKRDLYGPHLCDLGASKAVRYPGSSHPISHEVPEPVPNQLYSHPPVPCIRATLAFWEHVATVWVRQRHPQVAARLRLLRFLPKHLPVSHLSVCEGCDLEQS